MLYIHLQYHDELRNGDRISWARHDFSCIVLTGKPKAAGQDRTSNLSCQQGYAAYVASLARA